MRKLTALMLAIAVAAMPMTLSAAIPSGYYSAAEGKSGQDLLTALYNIIKNRTTPSYDGLWTSFKTTDVDANNKIIDMYSTCRFTPGTDQCGNYSQVGSCYNREHSFPKSWWGGGTSTSTYPYADLFHLYPTDGYVNNQRSNYPFGECTNGTRLSSSLGTALGRLGTSTFSGYTGTVFEPDDIYKGDFARTYFYIVTCYNGMVSGWSSNTDMLGGTSYPAFTTWAQNLLLSWHRLDAVSDKETTRNDKVYNIQNNRNPFIDYPELVEYIWGNKVGTPWYADASSAPVLALPVNGSTIDFGTVIAGFYQEQTITVKGSNLSKSLTVSISGSSNAFSCPVSVVNKADVNNGTTITLRYTAPLTTELSTATLTLSSSELSVTVNLRGQSVNSIAAQEATNVTSSSFQANWTPMGDDTNYTLHVYKDNDGSLSYVNGFPKTVTAANGQYSVYNLEPNTLYYYKLTSTNLTSNVVEVRTLDSNHILAIQSEQELEFELKQGAESNIIEAEVYTENITEPITLSLGGDWGQSKYELSKNQNDWSSTLSIDPSGETFYIRVKDTSKWGSFEGLIIATSGDLEYNTYIIAYIVEGDETFVEDWETSTVNNGYNATNVNGRVHWTFNNAGICNRDGDAFHGSRSCCFGSSGSASINMKDDRKGGASKLSFYAKVFGSDPAATITIYYSTDKGHNWEIVPTVITVPKNGSTTANLNNKALKAEDTSMGYFEVPVNVTPDKDVSFKLARTGGKRVNIDDITITPYRVSTEAKPVVADQRGSWTVWAVDGGLNISSQQKLKFEVYNLDARRVAKTKVQGSRTLSLPAGIYIVTDGQSSRKVIVR